MTTKDLGNFAENIAARYLEENGYEILEKNYEMAWGEIDIIASLNPKSKILNPKNDDAMVMPDGDGDVIIFVEVKASSAEMSGHFNPEERVNPRKLEKIIKTGQFYINKELEGEDPEWRVDVISITFDRENKKAHIRHIKNV